MIDLEQSTPDYLTYAGALAAANNTGFSISCWYKTESQGNTKGVFELENVFNSYLLQVYIKGGLTAGSRLAGLVADDSSGGSVLIETANLSTMETWECVQAGFADGETSLRLNAGTWVTGGGYPYPGSGSFTTKIGRRGSNNFDGQLADFILCEGTKFDPEVNSILDAHAARISGRVLLPSFPYASYYWPFWSASHLTDEVGGITLGTSGSPATAAGSPQLKWPGSRRYRINPRTGRLVMVDGKLLTVA